MRRSVSIGVAVLLLAAAAQAESSGTLSSSDYTEILQLYARYVQSIDRGDVEGTLGVFTEDAVFSGFNFVKNGSKEIATLVAGPRRDRPKIRHIYSSILVDPSPEGAKGSVYVTLVDFQKNPSVTGGSYCDDTLVKTKRGWRFKKRTCHREPGPSSAPAQSSSR